MRSLLLAVVAVRVRAGAVAVVDEAEGRVPVLYKIMESAKLARHETQKGMHTQINEYSIAQDKWETHVAREVVAGALAVELARAVAQVSKLLNNSEHDVVSVRTRVGWCALIKNIPLQPSGEHTCRAPTRQDRCALL